MRKDVCVSMFFLFARYIGSYLWQHQQKFVRIFAHVSITNRSILHIKKRHDNVSMKFYARLPRCWSMDWSGGKKWYLCFSFQSKKKSKKRQQSSIRERDDGKMKAKKKVIRWYLNWFHFPLLHLRRQAAFQNTGKMLDYLFLSLPP